MIIDSGYKVHAGMCIVSSLSVEARQIETGYEINLRGSRYVVKYPNGFWKNYPQEAKDVLNEKRPILLPHQSQNSIG